MIKKQLVVSCSFVEVEYSLMVMTHDPPKVTRIFTLFHKIAANVFSI